MKQTYAVIPEAGWLATTFIELEDLADKISSYAVIHPTGYKGKTENSDNIGLIFNGVTIRLLKSAGLGARGYRIRVEILGDVKRIWQGFIDLWMFLSDNHFVLGEPSNRVDIQEDTEKELEKLLLQIPNKGNDREIVKYWCRGLKAREIFIETGIPIGTIYNRISKLREKFDWIPDRLITKKKKRKKKQ